MMKLILISVKFSICFNDCYC